MRKIIVLMMLFSITFINRATADGTNNSSQYTKIEMIINKPLNNEYERSLDLPIIEAIWHFNIRQMEVTLYNIGDVEVYIVNSQNQVISSTTVPTDAPTTLHMNVAGGQGTYYIVVMSEEWYAEGEFTL